MFIIGSIIGSILGIVILIMFFIFYTKSKQLKELLINDVSKLKEGKVRQVYIENFSLNHTNRKRIIEYFDSVEARVVNGMNEEIIAYVNKNNKALLGGIFNLEPTQFPIRIVLISKGTETEIRMDECFGFQKFKGNAKEVFEKKNRIAFEIYHSALCNS